MKSHAVLAVIGVVIFQFAFTTDALKCIECGGAKTMDMGCSSTLPEPMECDSRVKHCKKVIQTALSIATVTRSCAIPNELMPDEECMGPSGAQTCIYYCDTDGCNSAPNSFNHRAYWTALCVSLLLCLFVSKGIF